MTSSELLDALRTQLRHAKESGNDVINVAALEVFLDSNSPNPNTEKGNPRIDWEMLKLSAPLDHAWDLSLLESAFKASEATVKSATLINGGAAVALLAFLGNIATRGQPGAVSIAFGGLSGAMLWFAVGVLLGAGANFPRYLTAFFGRKKMSASAGGSSALFLLFSGASFVAFLCGCLKAFWAMRQG